MRSHGRNEVCLPFPIYSRTRLESLRAASRLFRRVLRSRIGMYFRKVAVFIDRRVTFAALRLRSVVSTRVARKASETKAARRNSSSFRIIIIIDPRCSVGMYICTRAIVRCALFHDFLIKLNSPAQNRQRRFQAISRILRWKRRRL